MSIIPFEKIALYSPLSKAELVEKLATKTRPTQWVKFAGFHAPKHGKLFEGDISDSTFNIQRIIMYKNSFLPTVKGKFIEKTNGTEIEITLRLNLAVLVFISFWLFIVGSTCLGLTYKIWSEGFQGEILIPYIMFAFGFALTIVGFNFEKGNTKRELIRIFKAKAL